MSKGVGKALGIVAAIAIPFAAPAIAGAIGLSGAIGSALGAVGLAGKVGAAVAGGLGSGLVGAGLGAANAALTGGDVGQGALFGGLGSAIGGGFKAFSASGPAAVGGTAGQVGATTTAAIPGVTGAAQAATPGLTSALTTPGVTGSAAASGALAKVGASLGNVAPEIMQKAAVFLASGVMSGTSAQEKRLIQQAAQRMREIEGQDKALYDQMLAEAQSINPQNRGMQRFNDAKLQGLAATEAAVETVNPRNQGQISEVTRSGMIDASKNATLAYSTGYESGENQRRAALSALGSLPQGNAAAGILGLEQNRQADQATRAAGIRGALGTIFTTDPGEAYKPKEDDEDARTATGLI